MARSPRRRGKLLLLRAVAFGAVVLKRDKVAGLLPGRGETYAPPADPPRPGPSNYDAPGPVANTATPVPAPEPQQPEADRRGGRGGCRGRRGGQHRRHGERLRGPGRPAGHRGRAPARRGRRGRSRRPGAGRSRPARRPREPTAPGMSDSERQIDDAIEQAANPLAGEQIEAVKPGDEPDLEPTRSPPPRPRGGARRSPPRSVRRMRAAPRRARPVRAAPPGAAGGRTSRRGRRGQGDDEDNERRRGRIGLADLVRALDQPVADTHATSHSSPPRHARRGLHPPLERELPQLGRRARAGQSQTAATSAVVIGPKRRSASSMPGNPSAAGSPAPRSPPRAAARTARTPRPGCRPRTRSSAS